MPVYSKHPPQRPEHFYGSELSMNQNFPMKSYNVISKILNL